VALYNALTQRLPQAFTNELNGALVTLADVRDGLDHSDEANDIRRPIEQQG
jgi:hypothetical protein